jgi:predicted CXXCH cytochrome family protein
MKRSILRYITVLGLLVFSFIIYSVDLSYADHSLGKVCYGCHNLKSSNIIVGSQSISSDETYLGTGPNNYIIAAGRPFDCSFCHDAANDIPLRKFNYHDNPEPDPFPPPVEESSHPVDVIGDEDDIGADEIVCADCHLLITPGGTGYDIAPAGMTTKDADDGYPNHKFVEMVAPWDVADFQPLYNGSNYPNDANNKSHLSGPYGKQTYAYGGNTGYSDENRSVDWMDADDVIDQNDLLCFLCHADANYTGIVPPSGTFTGAWAPNKYDIAAEYNDPETQDTYAGHVIVDTLGLGNLAEGSKLPCYNSHDSHGVDSSTTANDKLILNTVTEYDNNSSFAVTGYDSVYNSSTNPYPELVVCAGCHDTGQAATVAGSTVEGLDPVDPVNSATWGPLHSDSGVDDTNMATASTIGCLAINDSISGGCHKNSHNPVPVGGPCWWCHGGTGGTIVKVQDDNNDHDWGRGGDFGTNNTRTTTTSLPGDWISVHNIDFSASSTGEDGTIDGRTRGSCTVCHYVGPWVISGGKEKYFHPDGDPRNDFRDVDNVSDTDELTVNSAPVLINDTEGYRYDPPWLLCVDCHDNENNEAVEEYFTIIGEVSAPLNMDEFFDVTVGTPREFVYGSGDIYADNYDEPTYIPDAMGDGGDNLNATPVSRYDLQPYKAHYYQRNDNDQVYDGVIGGADPPSNQTDPTDRGNYTAGVRIIDCLVCHNGHGSTSSFLYRNPRQPQVGDEIIFTTGREICLNCHDEVEDLPYWDRKFPPQVTLKSPNAKVNPGEQIPLSPSNRLMRAPPVTDRYLNTIPEHDTGSTVSCAKYKNTGNDRVFFRCHNPHSPSCETCHSYPVYLLDVDHD